MAEPNISGSGGGIDGESSIKKMTESVKGFRNELKELVKDLLAVNSAASQAGQAATNLGSRGTGTASTSGSSYYGKTLGSFGVNPAANRTRYALDPNQSGGVIQQGITLAQRASNVSDFVSRMGGSAGMARAAGGVAAFAPMAMEAAGSMYDASMSRIERGYAYSTSADKMTVMYQQMTGMAHQQVVNAYRMPLAQDFQGQGRLLLGQGGINQLLAMQAFTGINAQQQAMSVSGLRAMSGFSLGTGDITNMITNLASPEVANRMIQTTGMSLYRPGGGQRSTMEVIQNLAQSAGLLGRSAEDLQGAMVQGSVSRARLAFMGVGSDIQDQVIQYAMANSQFREKTGNAQGMYDPGMAAHRKIMGIDQTLASEVEETEAARVEREERFYSRQADNYAYLERRIRSVTDTLANFEDALSGIIGLQISTAQDVSIMGRAGGALKGAASGAARGAMIGSVLGPKGMAVGAVIGGGFGLISGLFGDPVDADSSSYTPNATSSGAGISYDNPEFTKVYSAKFAELSGQSGFNKMHPKMQQRVTSLIATAAIEGKSVGFGTGYRSEEAQRNMFLSRYQRTSEAVDPVTGKKNIEWDGSYWKHVSGAAAAPPGRSMHEIGLAADLNGDLTWVTQNAQRFGLQHFANVNNEPWHVQPSELPTSRREYEENGAPWGMLNVMGGATGATGSTASAGSPSGGRRRSFGRSFGMASPGGASGVSIAPYSGMSISQAIDSFTKGNLAKIITGSDGSKPIKIVGQPQSMGGSGFAYAGQTDTGDPIFDMGYTGMSALRQGGGSTQMIRGGDTHINISPVINLSSTGSTSYDAQKLAKELSHLIEQEVRMKLMRNS